jgi:hypothetical protein
VRNCSGCAESFTGLDHNGVVVAELLDPDEAYRAWRTLIRMVGVNGAVSGARHFSTTVSSSAAEPQESGHAHGLQGEPASAHEYAYSPAAVG